MPDWGTFLGKIAEWVPGREEHRRAKHARLQKIREALLEKPDTEVNRRRLADIDQRLRALEQAAINQ